MFASTRTLPEDASSFFAVRGKKSTLLKQNYIIEESNSMESLQPNVLVGPGKKLMKPNSFSPMEKRGGFYGWGTLSRNLDVYGPYLAIEVKEPKYLDVEEDYKDEPEEVEVDKLTRGRAKHLTTQKANNLWDSFLKKYI